MAYQITKENILSAAATSPIARKMMEELYPEAFIEPTLKQMADKHTLGVIYSSEPVPSWKAMISPRFGTKYENKGFFLSKEFTWELVNEGMDNICLVPTPKQ